MMKFIDIVSKENDFNALRKHGKDIFKVLYDGMERRSETVEFLAAFVKFLVGQK